MTTKTRQALKERPLDEAFIVLPDPPDEVTEGGVHITSPRAKNTGRIVSCGPLVNEVCRSKNATELKVGMRVRWWSMNPGGEVDIDGVIHHVMSRSDIATILEE